MPTCPVTRSVWPSSAHPSPTPSAILRVRSKRCDFAGRLHDIGMLVISDRVVNREGPLTPAEFDQIRQHTLVGHQLLHPYPHLGDVARFVRGHHERWDGTGYPDGLAGEAIPWGCPDQLRWRRPTMRS